MQDTASQFVQFTWMFGSQPERLRVGNTFEFPLALPRSMNTWVYDVAEEEVLHTAIGPLQTFHLKPRRAVRRPGEWMVEMWFAPELRFLPVRLRIEQDATDLCRAADRQEARDERPLNGGIIAPFERQRAWTMTYECILTETRGDGERRTGLITLNRPKQLNALNDTLMDELGAALLAFDADPGIGCIVLTGSEKAFAAGADIAMMQPYGFVDAYTKGLISRNWETIRQVRKPVIAAVAGFALGGGCELAMMCDIVIAADTAKFGQPEIKLGIIPGAGGTQRLPRAISKAKAMDMILTARMMDATRPSAPAWSRASCRPPSCSTRRSPPRQTICAFSGPSVMMAKEAINRAWEAPLSDGIAYERRLFHSLFGTEDKDEGMEAFLAKRKPAFKNR